MKREEEEREQREKEERIAKREKIADAERRRNEDRTDAEVVDEIFGPIVNEDGTGALGPRGYEVRKKQAK